MKVREKRREGEGGDGMVRKWRYKGDGGRREGGRERD